MEAVFMLNSQNPDTLNYLLALVWKAEQDFDSRFTYFYHIYI